MSSLLTSLTGKQGAPSYKDAHNVASRISTSALVKTALYGEDAKYAYIFDLLLPPHRLFFFFSPLVGVVS
jgi:hypothetical protein